MIVDFLKNEKVSQLIAQSPIYRKSALTLLRKPRANEIGTEFITYVKEDTGFRKESHNTVGDCIIARNEQSLGSFESGEHVYNQWLIPISTAAKNYGPEVIEVLSNTNFTAHKKKATLRACELTREVMKLLGVLGEQLNIKVSWSEQPMVAHVGDYLTDGGYSISKHDMRDYEIAEA